MADRRGRARGPRMNGAGSMRRCAHVCAVPVAVVSAFFVTGIDPAIAAPQVVTAPPPVVTAALIRAIPTSQFTPASPDPSGIAYLPGSGRFEIDDSEVDEVTGAAFHNVNMWQITPAGAVLDTGNTTSYTKEPTGLGFDPATRTMYISSDSGNKVFIVKPGPDGRFGTPDDQRATDLVSALGPSDVEDVAYDTNNGHMYISDGVNAEVWDIDAINGVFGDADDVASHFDVAKYGGRDSEGIGYDAVRDTLLVADRRTRQVYEVTPGGSLVRTINLSAIGGLRYPADVEVAPASDGSGRRDYWVVDREIDNGPDPKENDGMLFEVSASGSVAVPIVTLINPAEGATVSGVVQVQATASDDHGVTQVQFLDGATNLGTDTNGADGWSVTWDTFGAGEGLHTITATATDTIGQTSSDSNTATVDNTPPTVSISSPAAGVTVSGTTPVTAGASDTVGVASVQFFDGTSAIGTDASATDGWSVPWNTVPAGNGSHDLTAAATDLAGNTAISAAIQVTVDNPLLLEIPIGSGSDDAEEKDTGGISITSTDLDMMNDVSSTSGTTVQTAVGLRFTGVTVPHGAIVTAAYIQFWVDEVSTNLTTLSIAGQSSDNASTFTTAKFSITTRSTTAASVGWVPASWPTVRAHNIDQRTPDLSSVLQEIVGRPGWSPGNALALIITGSGRRVAKSFEAAGSSIPLLHIEYTMP
jgi:hypothetical protein